MTPVLTKVTTRGSALLLYCNLTRSSAVADRPRDASRLSVLASTVQYLERSVILLVTSASDSLVRTIKFSLLSSTYTRRLIKKLFRLGVINKIY